MRIRDSGRCQRCGTPGVEVDHIDGNSDALDNLQLLCLDCHHAKTAENMAPATDDERQLLLTMMVTRVLPAEPQLLADDENEWERRWRTLRSERKERFLEKLRARGLAVRQRDSHAKRVLALLDATSEDSVSMESFPDFGPDEFFDDLLRGSWN